MTAQPVNSQITLYDCMPEIPDEIYPPEELFNITHDLWKQVVAEVLNDEYRTRSHHNTGTYDKGCRGPLCRKALREHPKRRTPHGLVVFSPQVDRQLDPILEYFHTIIKLRILTYQRRLHNELVVK